MGKTSARKGFDLFATIKKGRIGLPKSSALVGAIQKVALDDISCREYFERFSAADALNEEALQKQASRPDIVFFLRGCKCTLFEFLKSFRKLLFAMFGTEEVKIFDQLSQRYSLVGQAEQNLLDVELKRIAKQTQQLLDEEIESKLLLPLLKEFIKTSEPNTPSIALTTELDLAFVSESTPRFPEASSEAEKDAALALLPPPEKKALLRHYREHPQTGKWGLGLSVLALQAEAGRKRPSMRTMTTKAEKFYAELAKSGCVQDMSMFLEGSAPKSGKNCRQLKAEHKRLSHNIDAFFRGVDATAAVLHERFSYALVAYFSCPKNKADDTLQKTVNIPFLGEFIGSLLTERAERILHTQMQTFLLDMRNEGVVSDLRDIWSAKPVAPNRLEVRCVIPLHRGQQGLRGIASVIREHPDMLVVVSHCPSLSEPLAVALKDGLGPNRTEVAFAMARLIHLNFSMKNFLVRSSALRKLVIENCSKPNFFEVMEGFSKASLQIQKAALGNIGLLRIILAADGAKPGLGIARTLFATPSELKALAQVLKDRDQTHAFLTRLIHRLSEN
jgi:hypothetical protein